MSTADGDRRSPYRLASGLVWLVVAVELVYVVASLFLVPERTDMPLFARAIFALEVASLGIVGALVATRQPRNVIGWILWSAAIAVTWSIAGDDYATSEPGGSRWHPGRAPSGQPGCLD